jgi:cyclic pyranopterin phosphate synthase
MVSTMARLARNLVDRLGRPLGELRVSVTDRCNFRCGYCMPEAESVRFLPRAELLRFEEVTRLTRLFVERFGVRKVRLTGGEPLLRRDLPRLVGMLRDIDGLREVALTTNGLLLADHARALADAGLGRVTVSLDALDSDTFAHTSGVGADVARVVEGIENATAAGLGHAKINCVVQRGVNEHAVGDLARRYRGTQHVVRFIEYMDVGTLNGWSATRVVSADEILAVLRSVAPLARIDDAGAHVAERYAWTDGAGEVGVIASVTRPFCGACDRARLSADGRLLTCLFAESGPSLRDPMRAGATNDELAALAAATWQAREDRYSERRAELRARAPRRRLEMFQLGG